jgi:tRNA(Ile)-lysidine synthase
VIPGGLAAALATGLGEAPPGPLGVAVSGGGDSVALLLLLHHHAGRALAAITVDHGLRPESAAEAAAVAALCARLGVPHAVRRWDGGGTGNLQGRAREARRGLIAGWAREAGIGAVALGHTLDDQAETFLMRLARGSGVDGLAAMAPVMVLDGIVWLRPLLGVRRAALRDWLGGEGVAWAEDPSNDDDRFDRVRARAALPLLAPLGLGAERLAGTAAAMARARAALEQATAELARTCLTAGAAGDVEVAAGALAAAPAELALRLLAGALCWVSGARYRPRLASLEAALAVVAAGRLGHGLTLHGCVLRDRRGRVAIRREPRRVAAAVPLAAGTWDGRWRLVARPEAGDGGLTIGALGAGGLAQRAEWRASGLAREALVTTPAVWRGAALVAAPLLEPGCPYVFRRVSALTPPWAPEIMR